MQNQRQRIDAWRRRSAQNLRAAGLLAARSPALPYPAVSRIYYACFQGAVAALAVAGRVVDENHGEVWRAAEGLRAGLGRDLWMLYKWRRRADYATGPISSSEARSVVAEHAALCRAWDIDEEQA